MSAGPAIVDDVCGDRPLAQMREAVANHASAGLYLDVAHGVDARPVDSDPGEVNLDAKSARLDTHVE